LTFRARKHGFRAYLAVQGGFSGKQFLGSSSIFVRGMMGNILKAGDILETEGVRKKVTPHKFLVKDMIPPFPANNFLRIILGPQEDRFTQKGIKTFLSSEYRVSPQSDRMGYRLQGPAIEHSQGADIISEPIARGAIQVPGDGLPILLLWDAQVSGGYTKIANVVSADLDRVAQIMPGERLHFRAVSLEEAYELLRREWAYLEQVRKSIEEQG
jgi:antagonist of KipI